jgi:ribosome biogenesis GTPase / thiamine phosphate phosphatase
VNFKSQEAKLLKMGWGDFFRDQLTPEELENSVVARVVEPLRGLSRVACALGEIWAEGPLNLGVGDWVIGTVRGASDGEKRLSLTRVLERKTKLSRKAPSGKNYEQILCANADVVFVVVAMTQALHLPGIERAVAAARAGNVKSVLVLTKADACHEQAALLEPITKAMGGVSIHVVSTAEKKGLEALNSYFGAGQTVVLLGASGAGKSTLTNYFIESNTQSVGGTREWDEKGRHTTTARRLHFLPSGGMIVDSPGIRELQLWKEPEVPLKSPKPKKARPPKISSQFYEEEDD